MEEKDIKPAADLATRKLIIHVPLDAGFIPSRLHSRCGDESAAERHFTRGLHRISLRVELSDFYFTFKVASKTSV